MVYCVFMDPDRENTSKRQCVDVDGKNQTDENFTPRGYQLEILETAKIKNTIACLGTGTGKTFIAVMLIQHCAKDDVRLPFDEGGKRIFFLVPTVPLVHQQGQTIKHHTDLKTKEFSGDMNVDSWNHEKWTCEFQDSEVLVMTAEIFRIIVDHAFITLDKIALIIFDECHRAQGDHPYCQAMKRFLDLDRQIMPKIFGLSASLINGKCRPTQLEKQLNDLEKTLRSSISTASDISDLQKYGSDPNEYIVCYKPYVIESPLISQINALKDEVKSQQTSLGRGSEFIDDLDVEFFDKPLRCLNSMDIILRTLGPWCAIKAAEVFVSEIGIVLKKHALMIDSVKLLLCKLTSFLEYLIRECEKFNFQFEDSHRFNWPSKLQRLLEIFIAIRNSKKFVKETIQITAKTFEEDPENYFQMLKNKMAEDTSDVQICSIVFVEQRITAYVLYEWVLEIKKHFPQLEFLNPEYIVGHGSSGVKKTSMSETRQKVVLQDFRKKKCNILISTCVLEEGMDVQQCNAVIRFDLPRDFRAYVQSKGRARSKNSIYVLMSEIGERHGRFCDDLCNFKTVEKMLLDKCHGRSTPTEEEIREHMDDVLIPAYRPHGEMGPCITHTSAISLINRYCANLPSDMTTKLTAKWFIKEIDPDNPVKQFECTLKMPINSPLRAPIVGQIMHQKKLAKMAAALKACQLLDEIGELNEYLVPISSLLEEKILEEVGPEEEEEDVNGAIPGTKRRRQVYKKHVPVLLQNSQPEPHCPSFLHILKMDLIEPLPKELNPRNRPVTDPASIPRGIGILLSKKLPEVNSFPLFTKIGKVRVTVSLYEKHFILSPKELTAIEKFHEFMFSDALYMGRNKVFSPASSEMPLYIVPVNKDDTSSWIIDWPFMDLVEAHSYHDLKDKTFETLGRTEYNEVLFKDAVILKSYKMNHCENERPSLNHVIRVTDKTPNSPHDFQNYGKNFVEYYWNKYKIKIQNEHQHLIETYSNPATLNWKPLYVSVKEVFEDSDNLSKTKQRLKEFHEYLVPELSIIHAFPSSFFLKVQFLPTILFRLHSLLLAEELRQAVSASKSVGTLELPKGFHWPYFDLGTSDKDLQKYLNKGNPLNLMTTHGFLPSDIEKSSSNKIISFSKQVDLRKHVGPSPNLILQALTAKSTGDEFDLERLEMIGDSFLKYAISVKIYLKYYNFDEGKLTKLRSKIIQNLHLYQLAKKKQLPEFLICTTFSCKSTWLPPCFLVNEKENVNLRKNGDEKLNEEVSRNHFFTKQKISDKCVADSVEALIGAYLLSCGQKGALAFMSWLGLNPLPNKENSEAELEDFLLWPPKAPSVIINDVPNPERYLLCLTFGFERFEATINYTFKDKAVLLQAFTHPSYTDNEMTDCFQRLEFLGDAVLDFLITRQLYEDPNDFSPGQLTDLRSALVNNIYFASLAVKYEYNKYLKMSSPKLFGLINHFIGIFQSTEYYKFFEEHGYLEEIECFELDEVEVPKALGDIFESVAGAIYIDSGMSLDTIWKVYYPMIAPALDHLSECIPKSPVREVYEIYQRKDVFKNVVQSKNKTYIKVTLPNGKEIEGVGPNKKVAKRSAAKRILAEIKREETEN